MQSIAIKTVAIIGLGYVGLPLAVECAKKYKVIGYDKNQKRIDELINGIDSTGEIDKHKLTQCKIDFVNNSDPVKSADLVIVTVPTPIDLERRPDLTPLKDACNDIAQHLKPNAIIVFESTVYPGVTEEICVPIIEEHNKWQLNKDFFVGYSPERINPGDKVNTVANIKKLTSGSNPDIAAIIDAFYRSIISAGTHLCASIMIAEAAKVIENTQRDVNIAFINELSMLFDIMNIDTEQVLEAARTKWNFLDFKPGFVGGHCIGVDPYYLINHSQKLGIQPKIMVAAREVNERLPTYVADRLIFDLVQRKVDFSDVNILVLGVTFKENCPDTRNSKVNDLIMRLNEHGLHVDTYDTYFNQTKDLRTDKIYNALILAVPHSAIIHQFQSGLFDKLVNHDTLIYDLKSVLSIETDFRL